MTGCVVEVDIVSDANWVGERGRIGRSVRETGIGGVREDRAWRWSVVLLSARTNDRFYLGRAMFAVV